MVILQSEQWYQVLDAVLCIQQVEELSSSTRKQLSPTAILFWLGQKFGREVEQDD